MTDLVLGDWEPFAWVCCPVVGCVVRGGVLHGHRFLKFRAMSDD